MTKQSALGICLILVLMIATPNVLHSQESQYIQDNYFKLGVGFEYFNRGIKWDDSEEFTKLKSFLFYLKPEYTLMDRITIGAILGYSLSNLNGVTFQELPFSVEMEVGNIGGFLLGGDVDIALVQSGDFEIGAIGRYVYYSGSEKTWDMPDLVVEGSVTGKPKWQRLTAGLKVSYLIYEYITPYLFVAYDRLWGTYKLDQVIQELSGSQTRELSSRGNVNITFGSYLDPSAKIRLKAEFTVISYSKIDFGFVLGAAYYF